MQDKSVLRRHFLLLRRQLSATEKQHQSESLARFARQLPKAHRILSYRPLLNRHELNPRPLMDEMHQLGCHIDYLSQERDAAFPDKMYEMIFVPALAVDRVGNRLGYGGGYYDRLLERQPQATAVVLVYEEALVDSLPSEPHDRKMSIALTAAQILSFE